MEQIRERIEKTMSRKLIIDGNAVYEIDEECMLKKRLDRDMKQAGHTGGTERNGSDAPENTDRYGRH